MPPLITVLTDFGTADAYVAAVKGVIHSMNPGVAIVDISHQVAPQGVHEAAFLLGSSYPFFPKGTVHLAVVDPGVGTSRRALLLVSPWASFVGPDNGIFSYVVLEALEALGKKGSIHQDGPAFQPILVPVPPGLQAYHLTEHRFWRHPVSNTFHARDIFGPVAAHLSTGVPPEEMGTPVESLTYLRIPLPHQQGAELEGCILHVDHFGNLITNIREEDLQGRTGEFRLAGQTLPGLRDNYQAGEGQLVALVGSNGWVEIALPGGSAAKLLGAGVGDPVRVAAQASRTS